MNTVLDRRELPAHTSRVLLAADVRDLGVIVDLVATLPARTRGQVFVEAASAEDIRGVDVPELVTVAWLVRDQRSGRPGTCEPCAPGVALGRAVTAWLSEMVTGDTEVDGGTVSAWILGDSEPLVALRETVATRLGAASVLSL